MSEESLAQRLARFLNYALERSWEASGMDGGDIQDIAQKYGLITETIYDPAIHGPNGEAELGDTWFVTAPDVKALVRGAPISASQSGDDAPGLNT